MNFENQSWPIRTLIDLHEAGNLNLSPPYQRNPVWTLKAQQKLLESILAGKPIPNFFLLKTGRSSYEMIDGQQRARTILGYWKNLITDHENLTYEKRIAQDEVPTGHLSDADVRFPKVGVLSDVVHPMLQYGKARRASLAEVQLALEPVLREAALT